jgi:hypothetical protein
VPAARNGRSGRRPGRRISEPGAGDPGLGERPLQVGAVAEHDDDLAAGVEIVADRRLDLRAGEAAAACWSRVRWSPAETPWIAMQPSRGRVAHRLCL